jgi:hypothetical protein
MTQIEIREKKDSLWEIQVDNKKKIALPTGRASRFFHRTDMSRLKNIPGYIWNKEKDIEEWPIRGMSEIENQVIFWGDYLELSEIAEKSPLSAEELTGLSELFLHFKEIGEFPHFSKNGFFRTSTGGLFCFPLHLMEVIHDAQTKEMLLSKERFNHPTLKGEDRLSYTLGILSFQSMTGVLPYNRTDGYEWLHEEMRLKRLPSLSLNGDIDEDLGKTINETLAGKSYPTIKKWNEIFLGNSVFPGTMAEKFRISMEKQDKNFAKDFHRRKNSLRNTLIALFFCAIIAGGVTLFNRYMEPPFTEEMTPQEVVEAYYKGIDELDIKAVDGTTEKQAGKLISDQVSSLYVLNKGREAYNMGETISPVEWEEQGYTPLPKDSNVYGINDLTIREVNENLFEASYLIWYPPTGESNTGEDSHEIYSRIEELTLIRDKRDRSWIIGEFRIIQNDLVPSKEILLLE